MSRLSFFSILAAAIGLGAPSQSAGAQSQPPASASSDTLRLSVEDAVALAMRSSDEARLSAAQTDVADAQVAAARANGLPQLRVNTTYAHAYANARGQAVGQVFNQPNTYNVNLSLTQALFQGGRIVASTRAAGDVRAASRFDEQDVRARLTVDVQRAYLDALFNARLTEIQRSNVALAAARVEQIEKLLAGGRAARYDVLRARVERANLEPLAIQAENNRELAILELKRILNIPIQQPLVLTTSLDPAAVQAMAPQMAAIADTILVADRPSVRAAEMTARARRENIKIARADFLPTASITLNNGYQAFPPLGFGFPNQFGKLDKQFCTAGGNIPAQGCQNGGWFSDRTLNATLSFPIFDGLRAKSNVDLARAQARIADLQLQQERESVAIEVARARSELQRSLAVFAARQQNGAEAQEAFQLANLRFTRGLSTQLEVTDAQLALLTAQSDEARATFDLYLASAELARSLGRPIPFPPTVPGPPLTRRSENGVQGEH